MTGAWLGDTAYPAQFHREMTPAWIDAVARGLGHAAPDPAAPFRWCELGCGAGLNSLVAAATHPLGQFVAADRDAGQIGAARAAAAAAGLRNLELLALDFEALAALPEAALEPFDVIVTHGVLSWIAPAQRAAMLRFIGRFLRPGGLVYAHYMAQPGLTAAMAAQQLARRHAATVAGGSARRAQQSLAFLDRLAGAGAGFFVAHPQERQRLAAARSLSPEALAHELLPEHWEAFPVAGMMEAFATAGCAYRGSATPLDNIDAVSLPAATRPLLAGVDDPAMAETLRDFCRNQSLRRDLYQRGGAATALAPEAHWRRLESLALAVLPGAPRGGGLTFDTPIGPVTGEGALFGPLLEALHRGPRTVGELARLPGAPPHPALLNQAVQMLLWCGAVHPVARPLPDPAAAWALNRHLARDGRPGWLAAPALGTALPAAAPAMAMARAILEHPETAAVPDDLRDLRARWVACGVLPGPP